MGGSSAGNVANFTIQLVPASERDTTTEEFVQQLDEAFQSIAGAEIIVSEMQAGLGMGDPIQIQLNGPEHEVLRELANTVVEEIKEIEGVYNPESGAGLGVPQLKLEVDRDKAAYYRLSVDAIQSQIEMNF